MYNLHEKEMKRYICARELAQIMLILQALVVSPGRVISHSGCKCVYEHMMVQLGVWYLTAGVNVCTNA